METSLHTHILMHLITLSQSVCHLMLACHRPAVSQKKKQMFGQILILPAEPSTAHEAMGSMQAVDTVWQQGRDKALLKKRILSLPLPQTL